MASSYPGTIDDAAVNHGDIEDAVLAVQNTLGVNPQGGSATVVARLDAAAAVAARTNVSNTFTAPQLQQSTDAGGLDTSDSTSRLTVQSYQTNGNNFFGEGVRLDLMRPMAKNMIAWRLPRDPGFDDPATLRSVAWVGAHYYAQNQPDPLNPTDVHGHWSIEVPDALDALRTRLEIGFVKPDGTIGIDKTNIKTNLADVTVRAQNGQVLRIGAGNAHQKDLVFAVDDGTSVTGSRWRVRVDNTTETTANDGSDFRVMSLSNDNTVERTALFIRRKDGRVGVGTTGPGALLHALTPAASEPLLQLENTNTAPTSPLFVALAGASSGTVLQSGVIGETTRRFSQNMSGRMEWGSGAATRDTILSRRAVSALGTDGSFWVGSNLTGQGGGIGVLGIGNANTLPTANPVGGGVLYVEAGALRYRGSAGTVTTLAAA